MSEAATSSTAVPNLPRKASTPRRWWIWLSVIASSSLVIQVVSVVGRRNRVPGGDSYYYWAAARLLLQGHGFISPFVWNHEGVQNSLVTHGQLHTIQATANWPPLFTLLMTVPHAFGLHTFFEARLYCCVLGVAAVLVVAFAAREIAGPRVGLVAAALCALNPNLWMNADLALSEVMTPALVAWVLWMVWRFWKNPCWKTATWLGLSLGVSMLGRDELALLCVLIVLPLVAALRQFAFAKRVGMLAAIAAVTLAVVGPWAIYNSSRFENLVFISSGLGVTLASANCDATWSGPTVGYWSMPCALSSGFDPTADESVQGAQEQAHALHYIGTHLSEYPKVEVLRVGRAFGVFRPAQQIKFDSMIETRPYHWAMAGLGFYYGLLALSLLGSWVMRRRRMLLFPLWMVGINAVASALLTFGNTRYRIPFEVPLGMMAAVALVWGFDRLRGRTDHGEDLQPTDPPISARMVATV